jgi:heme/copper-type cytochrome/quinol oxidase subunit 2
MLAGIDPFTLLLFVGLVIGGAVVGFFGLIALAAFLYVWSQAYPWLKMVGKWAARPLNLLSLVLAAVLLLVVVLVAGLFGLSGLGGGGLGTLLGGL